MTIRNVLALFPLIMCISSVTAMESAVDSSAAAGTNGTALMRIELAVVRPTEWPPNGTEAFWVEFRHHFKVPLSVSLNASVVFDTCILSLTNGDEDVAVSLCNRIAQGINGTTTADAEYLRENNIVGCVPGYVPVVVPAYLRQSLTPTNTQSMQLGYRIVGVIAVLLLIAQLVYGLYHFKGFAFIRASEQDELS
ncbi:hypothetical protein DQ04_02251100 [Trypanosoma grayi]|uniref:hypothetical protein n=1 Tax=Trypanosoma grayi TaxID=71804 RepID=UPI0004F3FD67|nr:hypothetical protein DQ04_02251100 [Trypanosoma grayi]KEG11820.1 hypothetical protein DQ04_02251100 [Trypanosoma grayi]